ncbi:MAG: polysaccharide deacetylase family protein [Planctomycetota bacterium]
MPSQSFQWPEGARGALSLTFDDARRTQIDTGIPILDAHDLKATFYVSPDAVGQRLDGWKAAAANGHEIGNHSLSHPCSINFHFDDDNALEDYSLERMERELLGASDEIERLLGVRPATFAYPCGQTFIGRGTGCRSYVPLVAKHFIAGRSAFDETPNDPMAADLAQLAGIEADRAGIEKLAALVDRALDQGSWLVLFAHNVGTEGHQALGAKTLEALCRHVRGSAVWMDTVANIAAYVHEARDKAADK